MTAYRALALQTACHAVNGMEKEAARAAIRTNIARIGDQIRAAKTFIGPDVRLVVLPEYFATAFPLGESIEQWATRSAFAVDGAEYEQLGSIAVDNKVFLSGNAYETDRHFPGLYFQTSFIVDDGGNVVLRYRRLISMYSPTPHDVWSRYLDIYGLDGVFPVADTALGRLAAIASEEILYPEIARTLALRGAEVFLHSSSEVGSLELTPKDIAKRARAIENLAYVVSANSGGIFGTAFPSASTDGMSKIVDFNGRVMVEAGFGESAVAHAELDLAALRRYRARPGMGNLLSRQRFELFQDTYAKTIHAADGLIDDNGAIRTPARGDFAQAQNQALARLNQMGVLRDD